MIERLNNNTEDEAELATWNGGGKKKQLGAIQYPVAAGNYYYQREPFFLPGLL